MSLGWQKPFSADPLPSLQHQPVSSAAVWAGSGCRSACLTCVCEPPLSDPLHPNLLQPLAVYLMTRASGVRYLNGILFLWNSRVLSGCYIHEGYWVVHSMLSRAGHGSRNVVRQKSGFRPGCSAGKLMPPQAGSARWQRFPCEGTFEKEIVLPNQA